MTTLTTSKEDTILEDQIVEIDYSTLWREKPFEENEYWFTCVDESEDALSTESNEIVPQRSEACMMEVPSIIFIVESGLGIHTIPLISMEMKITTEVKNWSSEMQLKGTLSLLMSYFNNKLAIWEPMIEPIEKETSNGDTEYQQWELDFELAVENSKDPTTKISVDSVDILEVTLTTTSLDVLQNLSNAFSEAIKPTRMAKTETMAPYIFRNDTGVDVVLDLRKSGFSLVQAPDHSLEDTGACLVPTNNFVYLQPDSSASSIASIHSFMHNNANIKEKYLYLKVGDMAKELALPVDKADFRYFPLYRESKEPLAIISEVKINLNSISITVRGILQVCR